MALWENEWGGRSRRWLDALFPEARELERARRLRRRWVTATVLTLTMAAGAGVWIGFGVSDLPGEAAARLRVTVAAARLPSGLLYTSLTAADGRLVATANTSGAWLGTAPDHASAVCESTTIEPQSLQVLATRRGSCMSPALYGQRVRPVFLAVPSRPVMDGRTVIPTEAATEIRIALVDPAARDGYRLGPVLTKSRPCGSSCLSPWIVGGGWLWIYVPGPLRSNRSGEVLRVAESTGKVVERWRMRSLSGAFLAVDQDGLWISGGSSLYRLAPGLRTPERELRIGPGGASWLLAAGHSVWLAGSDRDGSATLWRLRGTKLSRVIAVRNGILDAACFGGESDLGTLGAGGTESGLYCAGGQGVTAINPTTGASRSLDVPPGLQDATRLGRAVYFLSNSPQARDGSHTLYRFTSG